jgi:hypothetical protein
MRDIGRQQRDLHFRRTGIGLTLLVLLDDLTFLFGAQSHLALPKKTAADLVSSVF